MPGKLLCHSRPKDGFVFRMMKNVETNHAGVQIAVVRMIIHIESRYRDTISEETLEKGCCRRGFGVDRRREQRLVFELAPAVCYR
jgi:hypothetical protein